MFCDFIGFFHNYSVADPRIWAYHQTLSSCGWDLGMRLFIYLKSIPITLQMNVASCFIGQLLAAQYAENIDAHKTVCAFLRTRAHMLLTCCSHAAHMCSHAAHMPLTCCSHATHMLLTCTHMLLTCATCMYSALTAAHMQHAYCSCRFCKGSMTLVVSLSANCRPINQPKSCRYSVVGFLAPISPCVVVSVG